MGVDSIRSSNSVTIELNRLFAQDRALASTIYRLPPALRGGSEWYSHIGYEAVKRIDDTVFCRITLAGKENGWFNTKTFTDESLTAHEGCTYAVLNALSPTTHPCAIEWRKRARQWLDDRKAARKLARQAEKTGQELTLRSPLHYGKAGMVDKVTTDGKHWYGNGYRLMRPGGWEHLIQV